MHRELLTSFDAQTSSASSKEKAKSKPSIRSKKLGTNAQMKDGHSYPDLSIGLVSENIDFNVIEPQSSSSKPDLTTVPASNVNETDILTPDSQSSQSSTCTDTSVGGLSEDMDFEIDELQSSSSSLPHSTTESTPKIDEANVQPHLTTDARSDIEETQNLRAEARSNLVSLSPDLSVEIKNEIIELQSSVQEPNATTDASINEAKNDAKSNQVGSDLSVEIKSEGIELESSSLVDDPRTVFERNISSGDSQLDRINISVSIKSEGIEPQISSIENSLTTEARSNDLAEPILKSEHQYQRIDSCQQVSISNFEFEQLSRLQEELNQLERCLESV